MAEIVLNKKEKKAVEKEVRHRLYIRAKKHASEFKKEFKKQLLVAVSAAFGFLMAFSWREPITNLVDLLAKNMGASGLIFYNVISALILTVVGVLFLMFMSRWATDEKK
ncbi:hypothetical protein HOA55_00095 [archaeon]|jgi:hypothetical protein|nr:hypothetical protein [archaeon]MBT3577896.1 hypothetical protein [archaeon]MBT6819740.1 hypothetical protein [archaeon]MBT6956024.1 hypothetical protein [archaeon]MBT7025523.1 hypothetical protein [archaeon]